jgi:hypothetical protein
MVSTGEDRSPTKYPKLAKENQKRRGRKRIQDDVYFKKAKRRIEVIKELLKTAK